MNERVTKRKGIIPLAFFITPCFVLCTFCAAGEDIADSSGFNIDFNGQLLQTTCEIHFEKDVLLLDAIGVNDLSGLGSVSTLSSPFTLYVRNCLLSPIAISNINVSFNTLASNGTVAPGAFINQATDSGNHVIDNGVGFAIYDQRDNKNVLSKTGEPRLITYSINNNAPLAMPRDFYVKYMQTGAQASAGHVSATLLVSSFYE